MKKRIWELDALRGVFLIALIFFHLIYDLVYLFDLVDLTTPLAQNLFQLVNNWGGALFLILSGLCATIGSRPGKRAIAVLCGAVVISLVTAGMYLLGFADKGIIIYFGVLHCIGSCMLLWLLFRKLPTPALLILGLIFAAVGLYLRHHVYVDFPWLFFLGFVTRAFSSSDFFRTLYKNKVSLLPKVNEANPVTRFFSFFGKNSLLIYLLHQPILAGLIALWVLLM